MRLYWGIAIGLLIYYFYNRFSTIDINTTTYQSGDGLASGGISDGDPAPDDGGTSARLMGVAPSDICIEPSFSMNNQFSGRVCAGQYINESKVLKKGMVGCDVLLLQQRLNTIQNTNIIAPTGRFDCITENKLRSVKSVSSIKLSSFQPDEETGFDELQPTKQVDNKYRYMDIDIPNKY